MQWEVCGASRETGAETTIHIEAHDEASARRRANRRGIMVETVRPLEVDDSVAGLPVPAATQAVASQVQPQTAMHYVQAPPVNIGVMVPPQKGASGFGIAALVLGIIAVLVAWVPFIGMVAIPVALIALLLAAIGFFVSLVGGKSGVGLPVAGAVVAGLAIVLSFVSTGGTAAAISKAASDAQKRRTQTNQQVVGTPEVTRGGRGATTASEAATVQWAPSSTPVKQGDIQVRVVSATLAR